MYNRYTYSIRLGDTYLVELVVLITAFCASSCVTDAKVGEFQIPSTNTTSSGGSKEIGVTAGVGGSGDFETNNGLEPAGGEIGPSHAGTGGTVPKAEMQCTAKDHFNNFEIMSCDRESALEKIELDEENVWTAIGQDSYAWGPPLVANLTDDNGDGNVNLCDSPDILIVADLGLFCLPFTDCEPVVAFPFIRLIDGKGGKLNDTVLFDKMVYPGTTPAIGDIDRDASPDVVAASRTSPTSEEFEASVVAFERDGVVKWQQRRTSESSLIEVETIAIALADLDHKNGVEVIVGFDVFDGQTGDLLVPGVEIVDSLYETFFDMYGFNGVLRVAPTAADLDDDGDLEIVFGPIALRHNGDFYYNDKSGFFSFAAFASAVSPWTVYDEKPVYNIYPVVANLDDDGEPEVLFTAESKVYILENDGRLKKPPLDLSLSGIDQVGPATVHDFNGDDEPEIAFDTSLGLLVYNRYLETPPLMFVASEHEPGCVTSFDFQGDGAAEVIYSDGHYLRLIDVQNKVEIASFVREGSVSCPIVADVDNDDNAEIVIVNQKTEGGAAPSVQIIGEHNDRWMSTRRIWNEYNYHVTNVLEDSRIPGSEPPSWERHKTFRANSQVASERLCKPTIIK